MMKFVTLSGAAMLALAGGAPAQPPGGPDGPERPGGDVTRQQVIERVDRRFARLDADNDGRFTPEEARALGEQRREQRTDRMFDRMDLDHNGSITREEARQAHARHMAERGNRGPGMRHRRMRMSGPGGPGMGGGRLFGEQGFVTREQLRERALARFDRADANHDGTLTAEERRAARGRFRERLRERRGQPG